MRIQKQGLGGDSRGGCRNSASSEAGELVRVLQRDCRVLQRGFVELEPTRENFCAGGER